MLGKLLAGHYEITEQLGEGVLHATYLAESVRQADAPRCVIKQFTPVGFEQADSLARLTLVETFEQEVDRLEQLGEHPQIPQIFTRYIEDQKLYLVREYIEGRSLRQDITPGNPLDESYVIALLKDALEILRFAHENHVLHRHLKPENLIRRSRNNKLAIVDFGAIQDLCAVTICCNTAGKNSADSADLSSADRAVSPVLIGTPGYLPPEQAKGRPLPSSDLYALGMIAIEALTGIPPHQLPDDPKTGELAWRSHATVDDRLAALLNKLVRERYTQRFNSAQHALHILKNLHNIQMPPSSAVAPSPSPPPTPQPVTQRQPYQNGKAVQPIAVQATIAVPLAQTDRTGVQTEAAQAELPPIQEQPNERHPDRDLPAPLLTPLPTPLVENLGDGILLELLAIPGGSFVMGSPNSEKERVHTESPQHVVNIRPFFMSKHLITQAQWRAVAVLPKVNEELEADPSQFKGDDRPVDRVSWHDAVEFCDRLARQTGRAYRLPSEAEWEYACRAGTTTPFFYDPLGPDQANYCGDVAYGAGRKGENRRQTTPVGSFPANAFGLHDMHGNLWEWCLDHWHSNYRGAPTDGSAWTLEKDDQRRVVRGGSWLSYPQSCRSANRDFCPIDARNDVVGFRIVFSTA